MSVDPNKVVDDAAEVAKDAIAAGKPFWKSKTFWTNVAAIGATYLGYVPANIAAVAIPLVNILLRFITTQPVTVTP